MAKAMHIARPAIGRGGFTLRERLIKLDAKASPYLYIAPFFLLFAVFGAFPLAYTAWVSLTNRNLLSTSTQFVGLANYTALIHDSYFWNAVENTLGIWVLSTVPQLLPGDGVRPPAQPAAPRAQLLPDEPAAAAGDLAGRGGADLHAAVRLPLRPHQLRADRGRESARSTGRPGRSLPGSRCRRWSPGGGWATTR